ncbi:SRSO17 transposase [Streptomyces sp. TE33382]
MIIDDTGFLKKGTTSAGVQRQYSGTAGRTENCQIGVFAAYASTAGRALVDRELYLPKSWTDDRDRCSAAKVPDEREFATKNTLAATVIGRERRSCGAGAKGQREYDWAAVRLCPVAEYDHRNGVLIRRRWALARRSVSKPDEISYYLGYAPLDVGVDELVRVAGTRWAIEECFQAAKNECGLRRTRSAGTQAGTGTSLSPCSPTPSSP